MESIYIADIGLSNREYSKVELHIVRHLADNLEGEISRLNEAIDSSPRTCANLLRSLHTKRDNFVKQLAGCKIALAPHKRLPADVLQYVFLRCAADSDWGDKIRLPYQSRQTPVPITLSHVCRSWRHIVLATPSLWSKVRVTDPLTKFPGARNLKEVLSCVGWAPLSLSIHQRFKCRSRETPTKKLTAFVDLLQRKIFTSRRVWELSLRLEIDHGSQQSKAATLAIRKVLEMLCTPLPDLEILSLLVDNYRDRDVPDHELAQFFRRYNGAFDTAKSLPSLKTLHLQADPLWRRCIYNCMCWEQLHTLSLNNISIKWVLAILHQCRSLEVFSVELLMRYTSECFPAQPLELMENLCISLPYLNRLKFAFESSATHDDIRSFIYPLSIPNLKSLCHSMCPQIATNNIWERIFDPVMAERLQLEKLQELEMQPFIPWWPLEVWRKARNVRRLWSFLPEFITSGYNGDIASGTLFPLVQNIHVGRELQDDLGPFLQMIESRQEWAAGTVVQSEEVSAVVLPFKRVGFTCSKKELEPYKNRVEALRSGGLDLDIRTY